MTLTKSEKREIREYWGRYTKHITFWWHEFFKQTLGVFDVRFIPEDIMFTEIENYFNDRQSQHGIDNKCNYEMYFPNVKQPKTVFRRMKGIYYNANHDVINKQHAISLCQMQGNVIIKCATEAGLGDGVSFWSKDKNSVAQLEAIFDNLIDGKCDLICQEIITQHPTLNQLNPSSINCIRVMTMMTSEGAKVICSYLRMGQLSDVQIDLKGGCTCSIKEDGSLYDMGVLNDTMQPIDHHACGIKFSDFKVPYFDKVRNKALELHKKLGDFRLISWDFSVTPEGEPMFIEVNLQYGGIMYHQTAGHGPLFGDKTDEILNEVYGKSC